VLVGELNPGESREVLRRIKEAVQALASRVADVVSRKELDEEDLERIFQELEVTFIESDVAYEALPVLFNELKSRLLGTRVSRFRGEEVQARIREALVDIIRRVEPPGDLVDLVRNSGVKPYVAVFLGVNGVGKTTTIAKVANRMIRAGLRPILVAADTFRAGAQEQLAVHADRLGVPIFRGKYGADPAAVAKDAVTYASKRGLDAVLVDTAGRMHVDVDLVEELRKVVRVVKPHTRILVLDSLTGNDALEQMKYFESTVGFDAVILTKMDADAKGGCALTLALLLKKPIAYIGTGQGYDDLEVFRAEDLVRRILD
jgi:fused signal recognition particle receptor